MNPTKKQKDKRLWPRSPPKPSPKQTEAEAAAKEEAYRTCPAPLTCRMSQSAPCLWCARFLAGAAWREQHPSEGTQEAFNDIVTSLVKRTEQVGTAHDEGWNAALEAVKLAWFRGTTFSMSELTDSLKRGNHE